VGGPAGGGGEDDGGGPVRGDGGEDAPALGRGRYAVVRPARRRGGDGGCGTAPVPDQRRRQQGARSRSSGSLDGAALVDADGPGRPKREHDCALKIVDKSEFWSRVRKGRERADTLVREVSVQTSLAVRPYAGSTGPPSGTSPSPFLRLRNVFETAESLVLELELLGGTDLFRHVSSRGVLDEVEAASIMRDLLSCLVVLDEVGVAHRDIKPANLLMCGDGGAAGGDDGGPPSQARRLRHVVVRRRGQPRTGPVRHARLRRPRDTLRGPERRVRKPGRRLLGGCHDVRHAVGVRAVPGGDGRGARRGEPEGGRGLPPVRVEVGERGGEGPDREDAREGPGEEDKPAGRAPASVDQEEGAGVKGGEFF
ncbi:hypothetical protein THAOC_15213, partial [Thalassiosira oceanica]